MNFKFIQKGIYVKNILTAVIITSLMFCASTTKAKEEVDLHAFAQQYFNAMAASQSPSATTKELEHYLSFLTDDIGHSHLPYVVDDSRAADGKESMRKGMTFYLGAHTEYSAELLDVFVFNHSAIAIRYKNYAKGIHPQNNQPIQYTQIMMEVLEMEGDKVAIIRKYHE